MQKKHKSPTSHFCASTQYRHNTSLLTEDLKAKIYNVHAKMRTKEVLRNVVRY